MKVQNRTSNYEKKKNSFGISFAKNMFVQRKPPVRNMEEVGQRKLQKILHDDLT